MEKELIHYFANKDARTDWHDRYYYNKALQQFRPLLNKLLTLYVAKNRRHEYIVYAEVALFKALEAFDSAKGTLVTFIYTYVKNELFYEMRRDNQFLARNIPVEDTTLHIMCEQQHEQLHDVSDFFDEHIVQKVTLDELTLLTALYVDSCSYETLSKKMGVSVATRKKRRQRLIARLRAEKANG